MTAQIVRDFLDEHGIRYVSIKHSPAYTAQEVAASAHISGRDFAKTVILLIDGEMAMVVLPASQRLHLPDLRDMLRTDDVVLAEEAEFRQQFPDCELGAMPPFGNLYKIPTYIAEPLTNEPEIAFNAGSHTEVIVMSYEDYEQIVRPQVLAFVTV